MLVASLFLAGDKIYDTGGPTVKRGGDGGRSAGLCGPHLLALLGVVTGGAVTALLEPLVPTLGPDAGVSLGSK